MLIRKTAQTLAFGAVLTMLAQAATAQQTPAPDQSERPAISLEQARRIAIDNGMARIEEAELEGGLWEMDGRDNTGAEIGIDIRASDGTIVKIERDRPVSAEVAP